MTVVLNSMGLWDHFVEIFDWYNIQYICLHTGYMKVNEDFKSLNEHWFISHQENLSAIMKISDCILATQASHSYRKVIVREDAFCLRFAPRLLRSSSSTAVTLR